jgi:hypothetical protein
MLVCEQHFHQADVDQPDGRQQNFVVEVGLQRLVRIECPLQHPTESRAQLPVHPQ